VPFFSGSRAVCSLDRFEDEPNHDYELNATRQKRTQPHGGQLMLTTQVTKAPPKTNEDALDAWCDITALESEKWGPASGTD